MINSYQVFRADIEATVSSDSSHGFRQISALCQVLFQRYVILKERGFFRSCSLPDVCSFHVQYLQNGTWERVESGRPWESSELSVCSVSTLKNWVWIFHACLLRTNNTSRVIISIDRYTTVQRGNLVFYYGVPKCHRIVRPEPLQVETRVKQV